MLCSAISIHSTIIGSCNPSKNLWLNRRCGKKTAALQKRNEIETQKMMFYLQQKEKQNEEV